MTWEPLSRNAAAELVHMGDHPRSEAQLEGAVAMHNILQRERVAYLADEVGLGKTYVALATLALFRHFDPDFRVLVIAPRRNIQAKWVRDWRAFVQDNWLTPDFRVKAVSGAPAQSTLQPERLVDLAHDAVVADRVDLFCRLTSFSFAATGTRDQIVERVRSVVPWIDGRFVPRDPTSPAMRDFVAQAYNAALPTYDLVIIDEAHNLKHGVGVNEDGRMSPTASQRNAVLAQVLGHPEVEPGPAFAETYRPLADRVLLLSATPVEASFRAMWNQVHLVGKHNPPERNTFGDLLVRDLAASCAERFLVRRVNSMRVNGTDLTKNTYRRTWYQGGVGAHDLPLDPGDVRQRLSVALVQKRVSDVVGTKFGNAFQLGMLASFESFAETAASRKSTKAEKAGEETDDAQPDARFDGGEQTGDEAERRGVDTDTVNALARSHYAAFGSELAHPKMDALVDDLARSWVTGRKALVFVRRIASVTEIKRKLDERYDSWLLDLLQRELPADVWAQLALVRGTYQDERSEKGRQDTGAPSGAGEKDSGGSDTFFAWFFRGVGPELPSGMESGASVARKTGVTTGQASTFFAINYLAEVLGCPPNGVRRALGDRLGLADGDLIDQLEERARAHLPVSAGRRDQYDAVQYAGLELLTAQGDEIAAMLLSELHIQPRAASTSRTTPIVPLQQLGVPTFFARLHGFPELHQDLLGEAAPPSRASVRERVLRCITIATAARRGHPVVDLYVAFAHVNGAVSLGSNSVVDRAVSRFLERLDEQRRTGELSGGYRELAAIGTDFDLLRTLNLPRTTEEDFDLAGAGAECGNLFGAQQPTVGLARRVNATAVRQFRMPGYPYVLVCTDVLQEGEDLHTSCDRVIHYGVAWTPSAMEQRCGRVDRIRSLAERRFVGIDQAQRDPSGDELIQVQIPYLQDTVEVLQARRVIERMHQFTTLMHRTEPSDTRLDIATEIQRVDWRPPRIERALTSAFEVQPRDLVGEDRASGTRGSEIRAWWQRLESLRRDSATGDLFAGSTIVDERLVIYGSRPMGDRVQPFTARIDSTHSRPLVVVQTPVAKISSVVGGLQALRAELAQVLDRVVIVDNHGDREYDVSLVGDVILADAVHDAARIGGLVRRLTSEADRVERALTTHDLSLDEVRRTLEGDLLR